MKKDKYFISKLAKQYKTSNPLSITHLYSLFTARRSPDFYFDGECHSPWELVYVIDGMTAVTADDKVYTLSAGDVILHKPMEFHKIWSADGTSPSVLICAFDMEGTLSPRLGGIYHLSNEPKHFMRSLLDILDTEYNAFSTDAANILHKLINSETTLHIVINILEVLLLYLSRADNSTHTPGSNEQIHLYTKIAEILEEHIYDKITINQISEMCSVSPATIKNCFIKYAGCGVHKYFLNIKMRTAIELLNNGMNVSEVSDKLQFANPNYFSYVFKRETGMCASTFKKL